MIITVSANTGINRALTVMVGEPWLNWHYSPIQFSLGEMSAVEVIEQIRALPEEERAKVVRFVIEHEESWIPSEFREAMEQAAQGKTVNTERVIAGEKPPGA